MMVSPTWVCSCWKFSVGMADVRDVNIRQVINKMCPLFMKCERLEC